MDVVSMIKFPISLWRAHRIKRTIKLIIDQVYESAGKPIDQYNIKIRHGLKTMGFELIGGNYETLQVFNACVRIIQMSKKDFDPGQYQ